MAANTPVLIAPAASEAGIRCDDVLVVHKTPYSGADQQREMRVQIATTNSFPSSGSALVWDTQLREDDGRSQGDDFCEVFGSLVPFIPSTTYYVSALVRNGLSESSSWATAVAFTTAAELTSAKSLQAT